MLLARLLSRLTAVSFQKGAGYEKDQVTQNLENEKKICFHPSSVSNPRNILTTNSLPADGYKLKSKFVFPFFLFPIIITYFPKNFAISQEMRIFAT